MPFPIAPRLPTIAEKAALLEYIVKETAKDYPSRDFFRKKSQAEIHVALEAASIAVFERSVRCTERLLFVLWPDEAHDYDEYYSGLYRIDSAGKVAWEVIYQDMEG